MSHCVTSVTKQYKLVPVKARNWMVMSFLRWLLQPVVKRYRCEAMPWNPSFDTIHPALSWPSSWSSTTWFPFVHYHLKYLSSSSSSSTSQLFVVRLLHSECTSILGVKLTCYKSFALTVWSASYWTQCCCNLLVLFHLLLFLTLTINYYFKYGVYIAANVTDVSGCNSEGLARHNVHDTWSAGRVHHQSLTCHWGTILLSTPLIGFTWTGSVIDMSMLLLTGSFRTKGDLTK